ncbi:hypothetical protein BO71DRAFT_403581 [Aspergillus ellipticus CBS 707.79]|uniref:Uncharacterized protein n=1 Tax=Aspergillus ellipticus CBS 707.79 TaxID=1448320 RepID=A0A319DCS3_9EURO|nr:hypothetical protein BO71DRAFT_403581 [Aspergillus ellipticus CBS 707.79]
MKVSAVLSVLAVAGLVAAVPAQSEARIARGYSDDSPSDGGRSSGRKHQQPDYRISNIVGDEFKQENTQNIDPNGDYSKRGFIGETWPATHAAEQDGARTAGFKEGGDQGSNWGATESDDVKYSDKKTASVGGSQHSAGGAEGYNAGQEHGSEYSQSPF